jgi:formylmethanofuran dehydrogenase subunit C
MQITGHKNIQSINNYSKVNEVQHREISRLLSNSATEETANSRHMRDTVHRSHEPRVSCSATSSQSQVVDVSVTGGINTLFGAPIYGGNITVNVNKDSPPPRKFRRIAVIESDSQESC